MSIVMVDIDDCLMPWAVPVHEACQAAGLHDGSKMYSSWSMWEDYGVEKQAWIDVVNSLVVPGGIYTTPPYPGAAEALREVLWEGHEIHLVTARGFMDHAEEIRAWTEEWVEEFAVPGQLWFAKDKDRVAQSIGADYAVDDGVHNFEMLDVVLPPGQTYLLSQPHNAAFQVPRFQRVNSVAEFARIILKETA